MRSNYTNAIADTHGFVVSAISDGFSMYRRRRAELTRAHFCALVQHTHSYVHIRLLARYSRVRDVRGPQGRTMLHRELHYVYAHSLHCAPFSRTLSFTQVFPFSLLFPSLSLFLSHTHTLSFFLCCVRSFFLIKLPFHFFASFFLRHIAFPVLCSFPSRLLVLLCLIIFAIL